MNKFLIEVPHKDEQLTCAQATNIKLNKFTMEEKGETLKNHYKKTIPGWLKHEEI